MTRHPNPDPSSTEPRPQVQAKRQTRKVVAACVLAAVMSGLALTGAEIADAGHVERTAAALGTDLKTSIDKFIENAALPASKELLADSKKLLESMTTLAGTLDLRSEEAIKQLTQNGRNSQAPASSDRQSAPTSAMADLGQDNRREVSAVAAQKAVPDKVQRLDASPNAGGSGLLNRTSAGEAQPGRTPSSFTARVFDVGDKLKLAFYERVDAEEDKWGRAGSAMRGFQQRPELSGEFEVQEDGTVALPLLGTFPVAARTAQEVQSLLADSFETLTGRKGWVTVLSLERPPVYVMGPVDKPGSYKYVPGMTILHVIALAGGLDRHGLEPWQKVETVREVEKRRGAAEAMVKLIARSVVLKAERDGEAAKPSLRLLEFVNEAEARQLIADSLSRRNFMIDARRNRERSLSDSVAAAKQEVQMLSNRLRPLDDLIKLREDRVKDVEGLVARNISSKGVLLQYQSEFSEAVQRRREAMDQGATAKQRANALEQEKAKFDSDTRGDLENEIAATDQQIAAHEREFASSEGVLDTLTAAEAQYVRSKEAQASFSYEVIRQTANGPISLIADGMSTLRPGDLVRITTSRERSQPEPAPTIDAMTGLSPGDEEVHQPGSGTRLWGVR